MAAAAPVPAAGLAPATSRLTLERVIGITSRSNAMMAVNPVTGELAYAAGCIVVIYNLRRNKQVRYYRVEKSVACLCFSPSGQYLAIGEKGYMPAITIWDGTDGTLCAELQRHQFGVACMAFSRDGQFLLSAGLVHDQHVYAWDLRKDPHADNNAMRGVAVGAATIRDKVFAIDFCQDGNFFVTVGAQHFKFWFLDDTDAFLLTGYAVDGVPEIQHRDAVMSAKTDATFTGVACGFGLCRLKTFAVTADGTLCCFGASCVMERLVSLESAHGTAISVTEAYVAVAGASAIVRLFDPATLEYRATLPFAPPLGTTNEPHDVSSNVLHPDAPQRYPAVVAVRVTGAHVLALYSDRSLFVYDIADVLDARVERSFLSHSGGVRDLHVAGRVRGVTARGKLVYEVADDRRCVPNNTIVTCADDNTVRLWHLDLHKQPAKSSRFSTDAGADSVAAMWRNPFSHEMLCVVYHDTEYDFATAAEADDADDSDSVVVLGGTCAFDDVPDIHAPMRDRGPANGLRAVAIHPDQRHVAAGDKRGNVVVIELPSRRVVCEVSAHNTEVHCLAFSDGGLCNRRAGSETTDRTSLMASGGRDRLVHVYDCTKAYDVVTTLDTHATGVTALQFTRDGATLFSASADRAVVLSDVRADGSTTRHDALALSSSASSSSSKLYAMALTSDSAHVVTTSANRLDVHSVATCALVRSHHVGEQHRVAVCPASYCVALSGSVADRTIHVVDLATGDTLADATGHGEVVTALQFTPDCRRLVSASSDGCIFVWRLPGALQSAIKSRLPRVSESHAPPPPVPVPTPQVAKATASETAVATVVLPPPAPPIGAPKAVRTPAPAPALSVKTRAAVDPSNLTKQTRSPSPSSSSTSSTPSSRRRKSLGHPDTSAAAAMPKRSDAPKDARAWRTKAVAPAAGPMAKGPIDDWMRTRASAKRTVHVVDDSDIDNDDAVAGASSATAALASVLTAQLAIDRSQTPEWARTIKPVSDSKTPVASAVASAKKTAAPHRLAGDKWGKRAAPQPFEPHESLDDGPAFDANTVGRTVDRAIDNVDGGDANDANDDNDDNDPLFIKQQGGEVHQLDIPRSKEVALRRGSQSKRSSSPTSTSSPTTVMSDSVAHLSVESLEFKAALGATSLSSTASSLAIEREQLDRRRKQIETANAVAAMNSRLLQLGLLKPSSSQSSSLPDTATSGAESSHVAAGDTSDVASATDTPRDAETRGDSEETVAAGDALATAMSRADIPEEMLQSVDLSAAHHHDDDGDGDDGDGSNYDDDFDDDGDDDRSDVGPSDRTHDVVTTGDSRALQPPIRVDASLSTFTSGFQDVTAAAAAVERDMPTASSVDVAAVAGVSASISAFTTGYATTSSDRSANANAVTQSIALPPVDASLSQFTTGYHDDKVDSNDRSASSTTTNTVAAPGHALSPPRMATSVRVDESLSAFTNGFRAASASVDMTNPVGASMSAFTAGYTAVSGSSAGTSQSVTLPAVTASLSAFTVGYNTDAQAAVTLAPVSISSANVVAASLSAFTSGYEHAPAVDSQDGLASDARLTGGGGNSSSVLASLSAFTTGYNVANERVATDDSSRSNNTNGALLHQSLSAFTVGYETPEPPSAADVVATPRATATTASEATADSKSAESSEATVLSTISDLDQQLVAVAKTFEELLPTDTSATPEVQEIQQLVTQLRAAIERFTGVANR